MARIRDWLKTYQLWVGICVGEPLGIVALFSLFNPDYMSEFLSKAGFEAFSVGAAVQLIAIGFAIPHSEVKSVGWIGKLLRGLFVFTAGACVVLANLIYVVTPAYFHAIENRFMR